MATGKQHRCAVCWEFFDSHEGWLGHATSEHGALLAEFGYSECLAKRQHFCPGVDNARKIKREGLPLTRRQKPTPPPFTAKDGTVYTAVALPLECPP